MSDSYNFCLHTGFPNHREIVIPVDIDWEQLCAKICDELSLTGVQYLELCDMNEVIVGERISDIDDFSLSRQYVSTNTMYKVYGTAAQNEEKSDVNISVNKPVASLTSHSFGEVIMTPTYDPLNDLAMMQSVTSAKPKESTSTTPDTTTCHVGTSSDLQAEQLSSATTSTEVHSDQTKSALYSSCADNATLPSASQTSISHSDAPLSEPREQTTSTDFASSLQNILAGLSRIESSIEFPSAEAKSIYLSTSMPEVSAVDISSSSRPNMAGLKTSAELEMERQREEEERKRLQAIEDAKKLRELLDLERKAAQQRLTPAESEGGEVDSGAADEKRKRTEAIARERLAAKEARRQARIHEYEEAHSMDTSQSSLAGREHRSHGGDDDDEDDEKEWARSEEDKARLRAQEVERKKRVGTIASRRRASDGLQGGSSLGHSSSHLSSDRLQAMGGVKLPAMTMHHPVEILFRSSNDPSDVIPITVEDQCDWIELTTVVGVFLGIDDPESISHFILVDEDGDETSGCISDDTKFWKFYSRRYLSGEDMSYVVYHSQSDSSQRMSTHSNIQGTKQQYPKKENYGSSQMNFAKDRNVAKEMRKEALAADAASAWSAKRSNSGQAEPLYFRWSTDYVDERTEVLVPSSCSWEDISILLSKSLASPREHTAGRNLERISLFDDDGDEVAGPIDTIDKFWTIVRGRYSHSSTVFVATLESEGEQKQTSHSYSEDLSKKGSISIKCRLNDRNSELVRVTIPDDGSWDQISLAIVRNFKLSGYCVESISLVDDDGDDVLGCIMNEKKFWKAVHNRYDEDTMYFMISLASSPIVDYKVVFCRLSTQDASTKVEVKIRTDGSWEDIERALLDSFRLSGMCVERIDLIDDDGDDVFGSITNEKKFWKAVKSRYNEEDMTFVIKTIKKAGAADQASVTTKAEPVIPTTPLNFRLSSDNTGGKVVIDVPINGTWDEVGASVVNGLNLPSGSSINHIDLIDDDGDEVFSCIVAEQKFWKAVKSRYVAEEMVFVADVAVRYDSGGYPVEIIQQETVPFYFRLSTDNMDDKAVINIPLDSSWEDIVLILVEFFEIDARRTVRHIDLVDDDGDEVFSTIQSHKKFWKAANSRYNNDEMVFVVTVGNSEASHASIPSVPTLTVSCCLSSDMDVISELDIPLNGLWVDICDTIAAYYNLASGDNVKYIQLIDSDGDDVFSKIVDAKKFWKAAKGSYVVGETTFVIHCDFTYSSGYTTVADVPSPSSSFSNGSHTTPLYAPPSNGPSVNTDGIYKAPSIYKKPATSDNSESLSIYKSSTKSTAQASSDSQPHAVLHTYTPPAPGSKYDGVVVAVAFKMSSDFMNSKIVTSVPAMGTWGQINDIIRDTFNLPRESTIDHLELLSDEGEVLLGNIVSASKFWKACLEIYKDDGSTVFNIIQSGASTHDAGGNLASRGMSSQSLNTSSHSGGLGNSGHAKYGSTPPSTITTFLAACGDGDVEAVSDMLQHGADVNMKDDVNLTGIHVACIRGAIKIVQLLVDKEASITCRDIDGNTPLHFACENNHTQIAIYLVRMGADTSLRNRAGLTSLHYICMNGNMKLTLLIRDYMINVATSTGLTLLHCAADMGHSEMVEYLIDHDAQIQPRDDEGLTPLHLAVIGGHIDCAEILIDSGAYWNVRDDQGLSPLLHACKDGNSEMVSFLLDCGCNILARSDSGDSAMHFAGESGSMDLMKLLLERNVDINCRNKNGETPLEIASANGHDHLVGWMEDRGATMRPETQEEATTRMQVDAKTEAASRAFEAEEELNLQRELAEENAQKKK